MTYDLPEEWQPVLAEYLRERGDRERAYLCSSDLVSAVTLRFPDGFLACFLHAFYLVSPARGQVLVYTDRYGPQVFRLNGLEIAKAPARQTSSLWLVR